MTKIEQIKIIAIAIENENWKSGNIKFDFLSNLIYCGLIPKDYTEELVN